MINFARLRYHIVTAGIACLLIIALFIPGWLGPYVATSQHVQAQDAVSPYGEINMAGLSCRASGGSGGLPPGSHEVTINGRPAHVIVSEVYDPAQPAYLAFYLHGDGGDYLANASPFSPVHGFINRMGGVYVAPQAPPLDGTEGSAHIWYGEGDPGTTIANNAAFLKDVFVYMFDHYNLCEDIMLGSSLSGGSWFYDRYFFPRYGAQFPTFMNLGCGAGAFNAQASSYAQAESLSENTDMLARLGLHYTIGTADFLYDEFLVSQQTYQELGFSVSSEVLPDVTHCAFDLDEKSVEYWENTLRTVADKATAAQIVVTSGDQQSATTGYPFSQPLVVTVLDADGAPLPGVGVSFMEIRGSEGFDQFRESNYVTLLDGGVRTDAQGRAQVTAIAKDLDWGRLSASIEARAFLLDTPVTFTLINAPPTISALQAVSGARQSAKVGTEFPQPLVAQVVNGFGEPVQGVEVTFEVDSSVPGVTLSSATAVTDAEGYAQVSAQATQTLGSFEVEASVKVNRYTYISSFHLTNTSFEVRSTMYLPLIIASGP